MITWKFPLICPQLVNWRFVCFLMFLLVFIYPPPLLLSNYFVHPFQSESAYLELEEVTEWLPEVHSLSALHGGSPAVVHCKTPGLSSYRTMWNDSTVNFKLIETPKLSKKWFFPQQCKELDMVSSRFCATDNDRCFGRQVLFILDIFCATDGVGSYVSIADFVMTIKRYFR